jgi:hypothetical protein
MKGTTMTSSPSIHSVYSASGAPPVERSRFYRLLPPVQLHQEGEILFHLFVKPVSIGFVPHRHTHFHHSGDVAQKFVTP